jgi:hypothetical protein
VIGSSRRKFVAAACFSLFQMRRAISIEIRLPKRLMMEFVVTIIWNGQKPGGRRAEPAAAAR